MEEGSYTAASDAAVSNESSQTAAGNTAGNNE